MKKPALVRALVMGLAMTLAVPWVALADVLETDADMAVVTVQSHTSTSAGPGEAFSFTIGVSVLPKGQATTFPVPVSIATSGGASGWVTSVSPSEVSVPAYGTYMAVTVSGIVPANAVSGTHRINVTPSNASSPNLNNGNPAHLDIVVAGDSTPPQVAPNITGTLGDNGWYTSDVTVSWSVTDLDGAITSQTGCDTSSVTADTTGETFTCTATSAGGTTSVSVTIRRDAGLPTIEGAASPAPNDHGWNNSPVTVSFTCSDETSGIASCAPDVLLTDDGAGQSATGTAQDQAGNTTSTTVSGINIDTTGPTITVVGDGGTFALGDRPSAACEDTLSGLAGEPTWGSSSGGNANGFGTLTTTVSCSDNAGNVTTQTLTYTVTLAKSLTCFISPIKADGTYTAKRGSTIPMKCLLSANLPRPDLVTLNVRVTNSSGQQVAAIDAGSSNGNGTTMRYSSSLPGYIYNWQTSDSNLKTSKPLALGGYSFTVTVGEHMYEARVTLAK